MRRKARFGERSLSPAALILAVTLATALLLLIPIIFGKGPYSAEQLGILHVVSCRDDDGDGTDNYTDIVISAREYVSTSPIYGSAYYAGGYPNDGKGVCTDVIWKAFIGAGIDLKAAVDKDISEFTDLYPRVTKPDPNIDFRRVANLNTYFSRTAISLTTDLSMVNEWQAGDIVVFEGHIAICSDKRNRKGVPYIIHHSPLGAVEADDMYKYTVIAHYRLSDS